MSLSLDLQVIGHLAVTLFTCDLVFPLPMIYNIFTLIKLNTKYVVVESISNNIEEKQPID